MMLKAYNEVLRGWTNTQIFDFTLQTVRTSPGSVDQVK